MSLGDGIYCNNLTFGAPEIAITAAGYYYTAVHAWSVANSEVYRYLQIDDPNKEENNYTVEMAHAIPSTVNMAFACELAFKSIIPESKRDNIHKLKDLFDVLDSKYQRRIIDRTINEGLIADDVAFYAQLKECSNNFVDWRYFFEPDKMGIKSSFPFIKAMATEILEMYGIECS